MANKIEYLQRRLPQLASQRIADAHAIVDRIRRKASVEQMLQSGNTIVAVTKALEENLETALLALAEFTFYASDSATPESANLLDEVGRTLTSAHSSVFRQFPELQIVSDRVRERLIKEFEERVQEMQAGLLDDFQHGMHRGKRMTKDESGTSIAIGTIIGNVGNIGSRNMTGDMAISSVKIEEIKNVVEETRACAVDLATAGVNISIINERLLAVERQLSSGAPDVSKLRDLLLDVRNTISGAAGNLIASGILAKLNHILGTGVPG